VQDNSSGATISNNWLDSNGDPQFVNAGGADFHLRDGSPAIDQGVNVGLPYAGAAPDLGAYETGMNTGPGSPGQALASPSQPVAQASEPPSQSQQRPTPRRLRVLRR
jgi:hypothetical protein